jgi:hypothetical protein
MDSETVAHPFGLVYFLNIDEDFALGLLGQILLELLDLGALASDNDAGARRRIVIRSLLPGRSTSIELTPAAFSRSRRRLSAPDPRAGAWRNPAWRTSATARFW